MWSAKKSCENKLREKLWKKLFIEKAILNLFNQL